MEAAGLASSIITFIEVGVKVFQCYSQIRASKRGVTATNEHIETTTLDLKAAAQRLKEADPDRSDNVLYTLAQNCDKVSTELIKVLEGLHPSTPGRFRAFLKSIKAYWYDDDIRRLDSLLISYRQQLGLRLQLLMLDQRSTWRNEMDDIGQIGKQYFNPYSYHLEDVESELRSVVGSVCSDGARTLNDLGHCRVMSSPSTHFREKLLEFYSLAQLVSKQNRVLRKLYFKSLQLREDNIKTPAAGTFQWLVEGLEARGVDTSTPNQVQQGRISCELFDFLRLSRQILFISGKAGCGKSTIMKFLSSNERVAGALRVWAGGRKLVVVKMFFWRSDDLFLKSRRGFYRAILFHILRHCPEFVDALFPSEEESFMDAVEFPIEELEQAVRRLAKLQYGGTHCFCYFIDGLDEYEGDMTDQRVLAQQLVGWSSAAEVKIICSSRPNPIFQEAFDGVGTMINLHDVTAHDIERFAKDQFNTILDKAEHVAARNACVGLVNVIVERAEGVFLWASLIVRSLLNACLLHEEPSRLREILDDSPTDLNDFFEKILQRMDPSPWAQRRSTALLYMTLRNPYTDPLNALAVSWLNELNWLADPAFQDTEFPVDRAPRGYSDNDIDTRLASAKILLQACTQGLVELREQKDTRSPSFFRYRLEFFHRSVREYLDEQWLPRVRARSRPALLLPLQEVELFSRLRCAEVKFCPRGQHLADTSRNFRYCLESTFYWFSRLTVKEGMQPPLKCLQDLERVIHGEALQIKLDGRKFVSMQSRGSLKAFLGHLKIEKDLSWRWHDRTDDGCSFTHWAAYWSQRDYVAHQLRGIEHHIRAAEGIELNLLLSAAVATDAVLCRHLLSRGWSFDNQIEITTPGEIGHSAMKDGVPVWLVILRDFAFNHLAFLKCRRENISSPQYLDAEWLERWAAVIEVFLEAGASPRMEFILGFGHSSQFLAASLEMMLEVLKAPNWSSLLRFFEESPNDCGHAISSPGTKTARISRGYLAPRAPPEKCTMQMLLTDSWDVVGVQEAGTSRRLFGTFQVRVF